MEIARASDSFYLFYFFLRILVALKSIPNMISMKIYVKEEKQKRRTNKGRFFS